MSCHSLLACRVSAERSMVNCVGFPLCVTCCFFVTAFNIFSLFLIFFSLIYVSQHVSPWVYPGLVSLCLLDLIGNFFSHVMKVFNYSLFKKFLRLFHFLFFFWDPYNSNVGAFSIIPKVSETVLSPFHSFFFIILFSSYFHHSVFQLTYLFFCFS